MQSSDIDLMAWISRLFEHPDLRRMGHNQRVADLNLGLGWLYYALGRLVQPRRAVIIGSFRGFVPMVIARALQDNREPSEVTFIDPSLVDDFWAREEDVRAWFESFGLDNVRHHKMTTQEFVASPAYESVGELGLLFVDGLHSAEQARFDHEAFVERMGPLSIVLFHDSMTRRPSPIYGEGKAYDMSVLDYIDELRADPSLQVLDLPYGTGLTLVRRITSSADGEPPRFVIHAGRK